MKIFLPVCVGCPNSVYGPPSRSGILPGCPAHRQPVFMPAGLAHFAGPLDLHNRYVTLARSTHELLPPLWLLAEIHTGNSLQEDLSVEIVELHLRRIEALQPKLNAFVHLDSEGAREQARAAESSVLRGAQLGPLHGVPLTSKSCIDVAGWPCPAGSLLRKDYVAIGRSTCFAMESRGRHSSRKHQHS